MIFPVWCLARHLHGKSSSVMCRLLAVSSYTIKHYRGFYSDRPLKETCSAISDFGSLAFPRLHYRSAWSASQWFLQSHSTDSRMRCNAPQYLVDNRTHISRKQFFNMKYSSKGCVFLRFYVYLCHVIDDFCLFLNAALR